MRAILDSVILLVNVVQNPDGRVMGTRSNANGFDVNRDFITQSQPETRATVRVITEWNPMVLLDLHGFVNPMLIEPCTPPHNPNYEYDLYIQWALGQAEAMEAELLAQTGFAAQIPYRDDDLGWDDWPPSYTPMYAMYHGAYGHTLETPYRDEQGVDAHYAAVWGALNFVVENREEMIHDQIEIFRRGYLDLLQQPIPPELLPEYPQYQDLMHPGLSRGVRDPRRPAVPGEPAPSRRGWSTFCCSTTCRWSRRARALRWMESSTPRGPTWSGWTSPSGVWPIRSWRMGWTCRHPGVVLLFAALGVEQPATVGRSSGGDG